MNNKRGSFKQILPNGKPDSLYVFESPIDMLSYWSIKKDDLKNARLVSMNGLKIGTLLQSYAEASKEGLNIEKAVLAVDNDKGGHDFIKKVSAMVVKESMIKTEMPEQSKGDWNDVLKQIAMPAKQEIQKKKPMIQRDMER
jgi:hypothetical protein